MEKREFWVGIRQAILMALDAIERMLEITPTTAEIRRQYKQRGEQ